VISGTLTNIRPTIEYPLHRPDHPRSNGARAAFPNYLLAPSPTHVRRPSRFRRRRLHAPSRYRPRNPNEVAPTANPRHPGRTGPLWRGFIATLLDLAPTGYVRANARHASTKATGDSVVPQLLLYGRWQGVPAAAWR